MMGWKRREARMKSDTKSRPNDKWLEWQRERGRLGKEKRPLLRLLYPPSAPFHKRTGMKAAIGGNKENWIQTAERKIKRDRKDSRVYAVGPDGVAMETPSSLSLSCFFLRQEKAILLRLFAVSCALGQHSTSHKSQPKREKEKSRAKVPLLHPKSLALCRTHSGTCPAGRRDTVTLRHSPLTSS